MVPQPCWRMTRAIPVHLLQEGILIALQGRINESGNEWMCPVCTKHRADLGEWEEMKLESLGLNIEVLDSGFWTFELCSTVQENFLQCGKCSDSVLLSSTIVTWPHVAMERHLKCGQWDRRTEFLILFDFNLCKLNSRTWLVATVLDRAAIDKSIWLEYTGFIGRINRKQAVQLDYSDSPGVEWGRSRKVERKREKWDGREKGIKDNLMVGHFSIFPAASLPSCLPLAFHPSPSCLLDFLWAHPNSSFLTHSSHTHFLSFNNKVYVNNAQVHTCSFRSFLSTPDPWNLSLEISQALGLPS